MLEVLEVNMFLKYTRIITETTEPWCMHAAFKRSRKLPQIVDRYNISWILSIISGAVTSNGGQTRFSSLADIRPRLNSITQL